MKLQYKPLAKYNNRRTLYNGNWYASKREAQYAQELDFRVKAHDIKFWQRQIRFPLGIYDREGVFHHICFYVVDFKIVHNNGNFEYVDVKGVQTDVFKLKWKMFQVLYGVPGIIFTIQK